MRDTSLQGGQRMYKGPERDGIQSSTIVPYWICEIAAHGVDEDLVVVEFENYVGKPPVALSLQAFTVARGSSRCWRGRIEGFLDDLWDLHARCKRETAAWVLSARVRTVIGGTHRRRCER